MKIEKTKHSLWISHEELQPRCRKWLESKEHNPAWFPGKLRDNQLPLNYKNASYLNVVLFGDFAEEVSRSGDWPINGDQKIKLWVLCRSAKQVCAKILGIDPRFIGLMPRDELYKKIKQNPFSASDAPFNLVYSGRFVQSKNFDLFLRVASVLQTTFKFSKMEITAFAQSMENADAIAYLLLSLPWTIPPRLVIGNGPGQWLHATSGACPPILISLSKHFREDFGVSIAEAQSVGWPCILSDWGGHRDVSGSNILKVPSHLITGALERRVNEWHGEKEIAKWIARNWGKSQSRVMDSNCSDPEVITINTLLCYKNKNWKIIADKRGKNWFLSKRAKSVAQKYSKAFEADLS